MLRSISWGQFITFLLLAGAAYYLWVFVRYYRKNVVDFLARSRAIAARNAGTAIDDADLSKGGVVAGQATLFDKRETDGEQKAESFGVMEKVVDLLKGVIAQSLSDGDDRGTLLGHFRQLLNKYSYLKGTPYQVAINNFLIRGCAKDFSPVLGEQELESLWV